MVDDIARNYEGCILLGRGGGKRFRQKLRVSIRKYNISGMTQYGTNGHDTKNKLFTNIEDKLLKSCCAALAKNIIKYIT